MDDPQEFFDTVMAVNAKAAIEVPGDMRLAINAILTVDAFFGVLHARLLTLGTVDHKKDNDWKEELATGSDPYRILRDAAYALKHGTLTGKKPHLVKRPDQLRKTQGAFQSNFFQANTVQVDMIWIETKTKNYRAYELIQDVLALAAEQLKQLN